MSVLSNGNQPNFVASVGFDLLGERWLKQRNKGGGEKPGHVSKVTSYVMEVFARIHFIVHMKTFINDSEM